MVTTERKMNDYINDIFSTFDDDFEEMKERMDLMMERMRAGRSGFGEEPIKYGVSMQVGPDGGPPAHEFGNLHLPAVGEGRSSREPLTDVIEEKDRVRVIVELPGVQRNDINVSAEDVWLDVDVDTENRMFSRQIELPCRVRSDGVAASYKNGVLEITMDRSPPKRRKKRTIVP